MDRFVNVQNIGRYRKLASASTGEVERKILLGLLAEEKTKFNELQKARITIATNPLPRLNQAPPGGQTLQNP